jgi:hypothetical protein
MKLTSTLFAAVVLLAGACKGKDSGTSDNPSKDPAKPADPKAAEPKAAEPEPAKPAPAAVELVEHDLSPFGPSFKGYVAMAPKTAKIEFDDPSRHIVLSDVNFIAIGEAPYWEDGIAGLPKDKDNSNIQKISDTETRYERNPPIGKMWMVEMLLKIGKEKWSCGTGMTGPDSKEQADQIESICKSIKKK